MEKYGKKSKLNMENEPMRWQNPVSRAETAAIHVYPRTAAAAAVAAAAAAAVATAAAAAIALKFHPKHEKRQNLRKNETHYENITH